MVVMPSYFYKDNKFKTSEEGHFSNIVKIETSEYPLLLFTLDQVQGYALGYDQEWREPYMKLTNQNHFENLKSKFKN